LDPGVKFIADRFSVVGKAFSQVLNFDRELGENGGSADENDAHGHEKNEEDGAGARDLLALEQIDDRIEQVSEDGSDGEGEQDRGEFLQYPTKAPENKAQQDKETGDREGGQTKPDDPALARGGGWKQPVIHRGAECREGVETESTNAESLCNAMRMRHLPLAIFHGTAESIAQGCRSRISHRNCAPA
jgi:hypothetical protein